MSGESRPTAAVLVGAAGVVMIMVGGWFLLGPVLAGIAAPVGTGLWLLAGPMIIDAVAIPAAVLIGLGLTRWMPRHWRAPAAAALGLGTVLLVVGAPFLSGVGRKASNPSLLDRDYVAGAAVLAGLLVSGAVIWGIAGEVRARRGRAAGHRPG